jgi:D-arabinose 1-dehydrogenase-like Zn-dependent alcohol dehydrogenase
MAVYFAVTAVAWVAIAALVAFGCGRVRAHQRAFNLAAEAARTGGQAIDQNAAIDGAAKVIDATKAQKAAQDYLKAAGANGTVTVTGVRTLEVTATIVYDNPTGLSFLGGKSWTAQGKATVTLVVG